MGRTDLGARIEEGSNRVVTFDGSRQVTIQAGRERVSDPLRFRLRPFHKVTIGTYIQGLSGPATRHAVERQTSFVTPVGTGNATNGPASSFDTTTRGR